MKTKRLPEPKEADIQRSLFLWAQRMTFKYPELELLNASMNGAWIPGGKNRKFGIIATLKDLGCLRPGYPDINLPVARGKYHGLYIELKRKSGKVSDDQVWWIGKLTDQRYLATVARGLEQAKQIILMYLGGMA